MPRASPKAGAADARYVRAAQGALRRYAGRTFSAEFWLQCSPTTRALRSKQTASAGVCGAKAGFCLQELEGDPCAKRSRRSGRRLTFGVLASDHGFVLRAHGGYVAALRDVAVSLGAQTKGRRGAGFSSRRGRIVRSCRNDRRRDHGRRGCYRDGARGRGADCATRPRCAAGDRARLHVCCTDRRSSRGKPTMVASGKFRRRRRWRMGCAAPASSSSAVSTCPRTGRRWS